MRHALLAIAAFVFLTLGNTAAEDHSAVPLSTLEIGAWTGQPFVLLHKISKAQTFGYQSFEPPLPYAAWVDKVLTVTAVEPGTPATITFKAGDGTVVHAAAYNGTVHDLAPMRDLDYARKRWLGKSLWIRGAEILTFDPATDKFGSISLGTSARVKVKDIVPGLFDYEPVRFVLVSDDGREGFLDVQLSGTNVSPGMRGTDTFDELLTEHEPTKR